MWFWHPDFMRMVEDSWKEPIVVSPAFIYPQKLKRLKIAMKLWNQEVFGNVNIRLKQAQLRLESTLRLTDEYPSDVDKLNLMRSAAAEVNDIRMQQAIMLKQKSKNSWMVEGASNTSFFHNSIRIRMSSNTISEFVDGNGETVMDGDQIRNLIVNYYEAKFNGDDSIPLEALFEIDHPSISVDECASMDHLPTFEEIHAAVFDLGVDSAPGPDGFAGFFYRHCWEIIREDLIFTKILAARLGGVMDKLISEEQVAFMKGRIIHENISLASEMVNETQIRRSDGNVGLKLDITQAFDTVSWYFILEVFRRYGFSENWCDWILQILKSARISVLVNGSPEGFFSIDRGLHQGDPLSPLIFMLIEDVLSRNITKLVRDGKMTHMVSREGIAPTHLFFADDIIIFCKGNMKILRNLVGLLGLYQRASGQTVSREKSKLYFGGGSLNRRTTIAAFLGMPIASFHDRYLGVKVMSGVFRYHHVVNVVEKIKDQLSGWKGRMFSFQDRVMLVKSVIASFSIHNMAVYKWPRKFVHECVVVIRNFLWSGDSKVSRSFVIAYDKICAPYEEGGLGLTQLGVMNKALLMSLWWKIHRSKKIWARFLRAIFFKRNGELVHYTKSSILPGIKWVYSLVEDNSKVLIGDGRNTSLYYDVWVGNMAIADTLEDYTLSRAVSVSDIFVNGAWSLNEESRNNLLVLGIEEADLPFPLNDDDCQVWMPSATGQFTVKAAKSLICKRYGKLEGTNLLWRQSVHPSLEARNWKILRGARATLDQVRSRFKIQVVNKCCLCNNAEESLDHLLWNCRFAVMAWSWISEIFGVQSHMNLTSAYKAVRGRSCMIKELWLLAVLVVQSELLQTRNPFVYENKQVSRRQVKLHEPVECRWVPTELGELMLCCDGAARGNPGVAGAGVVAWDHEANVHDAMSVGLGVMTNYIAEISGIIIGMEWALQWGYTKVCIRSDSLSAVMAFTSYNLPWFVRQRWREVSSNYEAISFDHTFRDANFAAHKMEKRGCILPNE
ncbi:uncharacterized protein LOC113290663 [Papaver somniferum]|uniref:uncharacterized protein LOC113290663 n=1 Tax=Papaver somniferum TaxID=3469 RepID=UPI000E702ADE|nr:uncharacterized protein LOC113290663 [Papaver somniferum]